MDDTITEFIRDIFLPVIKIGMFVAFIIIMKKTLYLFYLERFENPSTKPIPPCPPDYVHCGSGDCRLKTDIYNPCP
jgi:hypothetical protein